jgi:putative SOS response-associated peptidase YedK
MCFTTQLTSDITKLAIRFNTNTKHSFEYEPPGIAVGFSFPNAPVITNKDPSIIQIFSWGLIPGWAKDLSLRKNTLNARIETLAEKPSFRSYIDHRCLVLVDGFYEWKWLDAKGKQKQKYLMTAMDTEPYALGGLWNIWTNPLTGQTIENFTIVTMEANEQMAEIHNSKKRMPVVLGRDNEKNWLQGEPLDAFHRCPELQVTAV